MERNPNIILKIVLTSQGKRIKEERNTEEIKEEFQKSLETNENEH